MERLQKVIASSGFCSRRKAEELIQKGSVTVNGTVVTTLGTKVSSNDTIEIEGKMLSLTSDKVYFLLNKPRGVVSTASDEKGRKTVTDLIETDKRIYPVGRLDYDTTGLLILTNDGDLTNLLTHPSHEVAKGYLAKIEGVLDKEAISKLKKGPVVEGRQVKVIDFKIKKKDLNKNVSYVLITIIEGRNHIIKKLFATLGYDVQKLTRVSYDFLTLGNLKSGEYRLLSLKEVRKLYRK